LGAFFAASGLIDESRTAGFSGPTPCDIILVNALTGSREFLGVPQKTGLSAPILYAAARHTSISASIPCAAEIRQSLPLSRAINGTPAV
jgi:hypothetical protein